jgi:ribonuclease HI
MEDKIIIYTDGACLGNPGRGAYAAVLIWGDKRKEISGGYRLTTNNRMEIKAAVEAIKLIKVGKKYDIILHSDSRLLVDSVNKEWLDKWKAKSWMRNNKDKVLNPDLWAELYDLLQIHNVEFKWVKSHVGIPENERCDQLSKAAAAADVVQIDEVYEKSIDNNMFLKLL